MKRMREIIIVGVRSAKFCWVRYEVVANRLKVFER